jgi:NADH-quinone oxidoreductase subunit M
VALGTTYILWLYYRVVMGDPRPGLRGLRLDLNGREMVTLAPLVLLTVVIGLYPESVLGFLRASVAQLLAAAAPGAVAGRM